MITQVWGMLGDSRIVFDKTDGNIWKATVPFMESGEYIVALYAVDEAGNQAYMATILYTVDLEKLRYEIKMLDYSAQGSMRDFKVILEKLEGSVTSVGNTENVSGREKKTVSVRKIRGYSALRNDQC